MYVCSGYQERRLRPSHGQVLEYILTKKELVLWSHFPSLLKLK